MEPEPEAMTDSHQEVYQSDPPMMYPLNLTMTESDEPINLDTNYENTSAEVYIKQEPNDSYYQEESDTGTADYCSKPTVEPDTICIEPGSSPEETGEDYPMNLTMGESDQPHHSDIANLSTEETVESDAEVPKSTELESSPNHSNEDNPMNLKMGETGKPNESGTNVEGSFPEVLIKEEPNEAYYPEEPGTGESLESEVEEQEIADESFNAESHSGDLSKEDSELVERSVYEAVNDSAHAWTENDSPKAWTDNASDRPYSCHYCTYRAKLLPTLKRHIKAIHTKEKPFKCPQCDYAAIQHHNLTRHIKVKHRNEKSFKCPHCDYHATQRNHLKQHFLSKHAPEKQFSCTECDFSAALANTLKNHVIAKHSKVKPFVCTECDYRASQGGALKRHILAIHAQQRPFNCEFCDYSTTRNFYLKRHILNKHT